MSVQEMADIANHSRATSRKHHNEKIPGGRARISLGRSPQAHEERRSRATGWVGRRIVKEEQGGQARAGYGETVIDRLAADLTSRIGRGFGRRNHRPSTRTRLCF